MSIMRVVRDVKRAAFAFFDEPADMDIAHDSNGKDALLANGYLKSNAAVAETDLDDASWDDVGPFSGSGPLKIKLPEDSSVDIDLDFDQENKDDKKLFTRSGKKLNIVDEDWDNDFAEETDKLQNKLATKGTTTPPAIPGTGTAAGTSAINLNLITNLGNKGGSISEKKPFALLKSDAPSRRSFIAPDGLINNLNNRGGSIKKPASDEDDEIGLEIPAEPLRLKLNRVPVAVSAPEEDVTDLDGEGAVDSGSIPDEQFEEEEVEEEDWNDVELPPTLGEPVTKRPGQANQALLPDKEEWDDLEIPADKLALKLAQQKLAAQAAAPAQATQKPSKSRDEDSWDDVDIPENFQLRLKKK